MMTGDTLKVNGCGPCYQLPVVTNIYPREIAQIPGHIWRVLRTTICTRHYIIAQKLSDKLHTKSFGFFFVIRILVVCR